MGIRVKEDEKNERIIRGLLKLPANRRCINCNNLGPQYVCTNFWTFICTNCSGIHREFTHRVKSVSMAKFTSQEVASLQDGGNDCAKAIYLKEWNPACQSLPDSSKIDRLRDFIKHVFVDRRYAGDWNGEKPERMKGDRDDNNENQRAESYRGGSRSPSNGDQYNPSYGVRNDDCSFRVNYRERSPGYDPGVNKGSLAQFEVVDVRFREYNPPNGSQNKRLEDCRLAGMLKPEGRSPDHQKNITLSPPVVCPVQDILGDDVPQLQVGGSLKSNGTRVSEEPTKIKSSLSLSSVGSTEANSTQPNVSYSESLIDFNVDPEPTVAATAEQSIPQQSNPVLSNGNDWAAFGTSGQQDVPQGAPSANPLESAFSQLSASESAPSGNMSTLSSGIDSFPKVADGCNLPTKPQQKLSVFPSDNNQHTNQPSNAPAVGASINQNLVSSLAPNGKESFTVATANPAGHLPKVFAKPVQKTSSGVSSQPSSADNKSSGRKELPADFFTSLYPNTPASAPAWQRMSYPMQYPASVHIPAFTQMSISSNPFNIASDPPPMFISVTPQQAELPNMTPSATLLRSSSFGAPAPRWVPSQQSPYASGVSPSPFAMPQFPNNMPQEIANTTISMGDQIFANSGTQGTAFGTFSFDQNPAIRYSQPSTPNSYIPAGGNPFG